MFFFIVIGTVSLPTLQRATFPDFHVEIVQVMVAYPGASAHDVEEAICRRIEEAIDGIENVKEIVTDARESLGVVTVEMQSGGDLRAFLDDIRTEVNAITEFPERAETPVVKELNITDAVVSIAVTGSMKLSDLKAYCEELKDHLKIDGGISQVSISGFSDRQIRIEIPATILMQYNLSLDDIAGVIARQSVDLPAGAIETGERDILIRFVEERKTVQAFQNLVVVSGSSGAVVYLGDIATIRDDFELAEEKYIYNGKRAGLLEISKTKSEDTLKIFDAVKTVIEREQAVAPPGVLLNMTNDISSIVRDRLRLLITNSLQGLFLVFLVMWLFFNFRLSFWVTAGLPVCFFGTFFLMPFIDYSLNMMTMVGLLIGLGILMDDAIVIAENIMSHLSKGKSALNAAIDGVSEVKNGIIASFTTTICVFGPLVILEGAMGKVLRVMPVILILVLAISLIEAFWILPNHLAHSLAGLEDRAVTTFRQRFEAAIDYFRENILGRVVDTCVTWRYLTVGCAIGMLILSIGLLPAGILKFKGFPDLEGDVIAARVLLPQGTPLSRTESVVTKLTEAIWQVDAEFSPEQPQGKHLVQSVSVQYNLNTEASESGAHVATVLADLLSTEERVTSADDVAHRWRQLTGDVTDVLSLTFGETIQGPAGRPIDIRLQGSDLLQLKDASLLLQEWLKQFDGVFDLSDNLRPGKPEINVQLLESAKILGLDAQTIASQLRSAFYGRTASEIQVGRESYQIDVRLRKADRNSLEDLSYFHATLPDGKQVPINSVATFSLHRGFSRIAGVDGLRTVTVQGDVNTRVTNVSQIMASLRQSFLPVLQNNYPGVRLSFEGESKANAETGGSMLKGFIIGLVGIFILLSFQFRSYFEPLVVMVAIPLAFIGVIWGHVVMGMDLTMPSLMGGVSLAGIVVNDSILLVVFTKNGILAGRSIVSAACQASRERFRAVLLTSLTTIAGLLPLLSERSTQAQALIPMAVSIVFGLAATTILVLIIVPSMYAILGDFGMNVKLQVGEKL